MYVFLSRRAVRQLSRCVNDHLTAEPHRTMFYSAIQPFTAFVVTVIYSIRNHKLLLLLDCFGLVRLVLLYVRVHTITQIRFILSDYYTHAHTDLTALL